MHVSLPTVFLTWISSSKLTSELTMAQSHLEISWQKKVVRNMISLKQLIKTSSPLCLRHRTELQNIASVLVLKVYVSERVRRQQIWQWIKTVPLFLSKLRVYLPYKEVPSCHIGDPGYWHQNKNLNPSTLPKTHTQKIKSQKQAKRLERL